VHLLGRLDGKIATETGHSQWITGEEARRHSRTLREEYDAILVGASTVLVDDPLLTRRLGLAKGILPHRRIVLDGRLRVSPEARIFNTPEGGETWIATAVHEEDHACEPFLERGVRILSLRDPDGTWTGSTSQRWRRGVLPPVEGGGDLLCSSPRARGSRHRHLRRSSSGRRRAVVPPATASRWSKRPAFRSREAGEDPGSAALCVPGPAAGG
jgi:diaminohydroxyphosphoribosylaminopyrimidine deaminase/5-amino-6-(5-phosphoribosylamino)uracil reductase